MGPPAKVLTKEQRLAAVARKQRGVFRRAQAVTCGFTPAEVKRLIRAQDWVLVRHGIYATAAQHTLSSATPVGTHLLAAAARQLAVGGDTVISHESAALLHGMTLLDPVPAEPRLTLHQPGGPLRITAHGLYVASVPPEHRHAGGLITTAARTVVDCARCLSREAAFVIAESALRLGLDRLAVLDVLHACHGWPGTAQARELVLLAGPWSESPLESRARLWFRAQGLPQPDQQRWITRLDGGFVARVDFLWPQFRTVCETDGRIKYDEPQREADKAPVSEKARRDALWREKLREDTLRDLGLEVARGYWSDGEDDGAALAERLRRAFARGQRAVDDPAYRIVCPSPEVFRPLAVGS